MVKNTPAKEDITRWTGKKGMEWLEYDNNMTRCRNKKLQSSHSRVDDYDIMTQNTIHRDFAITFPFKMSHYCQTLRYYDCSMLRLQKRMNEVFARVIAHVYFFSLYFFSFSFLFIHSHNDFSYILTPAPLAFSLLSLNTHITLPCPRTNHTRTSLSIESAIEMPSVKN